MNYRIELFDQGAPADTTLHGGSRESAIATARIELRQHQQAEIVRIVDVKRSGAEVWSEWRDHLR